MTANDMHGFICGEDDDGFDEARCSCGWVGGMAPDIETAADIWADHIVHLVASQYEARITELEAAIPEDIARRIVRYHDEQRHIAEYDFWFIADLCRTRLAALEATDE